MELESPFIVYIFSNFRIKKILIILLKKIIK